MKYFTDDKCQSGEADSEYAAYCRSIWDLLPDSLKEIQDWQLPDDLCHFDSKICLHDGKLRNMAHDSRRITAEIETDFYGASRRIFLSYGDAVVVQSVDVSMHNGTATYGDDDIMCTEITVCGDRYQQSLLFASGQELILEFSEFSFRYSDAS
ncbi:MAG: hypothetical protein QGG42_07175 [Phycisphaerae bacterium]|jgi:hypothetical protein|nr:hypothetical protein [Phycisphaerae bacterium]